MVIDKNVEIIELKAKIEMQKNVIKELKSGLEWMNECQRTSRLRITAKVKELKAILDKQCQEISNTI